MPSISNTGTDPATRDRLGRGPCAGEGTRSLLGETREGENALRSLRAPRGMAPHPEIRSRSSGPGGGPRARGAEDLPGGRPGRIGPESPRPAAQVDGKRSLLQLRAFVNESAGKFTYDAGRIDIHPDGKIGFVDLTMEQVPLALEISRDPAQIARLRELRVDWPGGPDPLAREASYVALAKSGELERRIARLKEIRQKDAYGVFARARAGSLRIGGSNLNVGEEKEISGCQGSGTVYFSSCSMACVFCQYADIARLKGGGDVTTKDLAELFLDLQNRGAHNIQLMTPSHYVVEIVEALKIAAGRGLEIPLVYNTGGYEDLDALKALEGIIDIYLPDVKFGNNDAGKRYGGTPGYWDNVKSAVREMHRQVGDLETDERGVAHRGVLVRHLVMPNDVADSKPVAEFLASISPNLHVHLLDQWRPDFAVPAKFPEIDRPITREEFASTRRTFEAAGITRGLDRTQQEAGV